jgi:predicted DNA-binding transcriptional regulator AlpA
MNKSDKLLVQIQEIADFVGLSVKTVKKLAENNDMPADKIDGTWYSHKDAIEQWIFERCYSKKKLKRKAVVK